METYRLMLIYQDQPQETAGMYQSGPFSLIYTRKGLCMQSLVNFARHGGFPELRLSMRALNLRKSPFKKQR